MNNESENITTVSEFLVWSEASKKEIIDKILQLEQFPSELIAIFDEIYQYLSEEDILPDTLVADTIFVFGSASTLRTEKAIELYKAGFGKTITISGHKPFYTDQSITEAEYLGEYAVANGIPRKYLILEKKGLSLPDNVKRTLDLFNEKQFNYKEIIIVCSPFAQRRAYSEWLKYPETPINIYRQKAVWVKSTTSKIGTKHLKG